MKDDRHLGEAGETEGFDAGEDEPLITSGHRQQQARPQTLTAGSFDDHQNLENAARCGADDFLSKPFTQKQLIEKVQGLLGSGCG